LDDALDPELGCQLSVEKSALLRIVSNLINNSVESISEKILRSGEVGNVVVSVRKSTRPSGLIIRVEDDGLGFISLKRGRIPKSTKGGFGIGLSSAKQILESWGGALTLQAVPKGGAAVEVFLRAS
jgi:signal transduction histidine kinase